MFVQYRELAIEPYDKHYPRKECCEGCAFVRTTHQCAHPYRCLQTAKELYDTLSPICHPEQQVHQDGLTLTHQRHEKNQRRKDSNKYITFDPSIVVPYLKQFLDWRVKAVSVREGVFLFYFCSFEHYCAVFDSPMARPLSPEDSDRWK